VAWNCDVVLATFEGGQSEVTTGLAGDPAAEIGEGCREVRRRRRGPPNRWNGDGLSPVVRRSQQRLFPLGPVGRPSRIGSRIAVAGARYLGYPLEAGVSRFHPEL